MSNKYHIVVDSMSTISEKFLKENNISTINYSVNDVNGNLIKDDFTDAVREKVVNEIEKGNSQKTSFVSSAVLENIFDDLTSRYEHVIYICADLGYTSQYNCAKPLMEKYNNKLWVINSNSIGSTIESLVREIIEKINSGAELTYESVTKLAMDVAARSIIIFSPKDVNGMLHSGRVPPIVVKLFKLTKTHPLLKCEEKIKATKSVVRKWDNIWQKTCEMVQDIFMKQLNENNIKYIYLWNSLRTHDEIEKIKDILVNYFKIPKQSIIVRSTPLPILVYVLRHSVGVSVTTVDVYKK